MKARRPRGGLRALDATGDYQQAERIAREILEEHGVPPLAVEKAMGGMYMGAPRPPGWVPLS